MRTLTLLLMIGYLLTALVNDPLSAQTRAVTELGDTIFVFDDGSWSYDAEKIWLEEEDESLAYMAKVFTYDTLETPLTKPVAATKELVSDLAFYKLAYDPNTWRRIPAASLNPVAEFALQARSGDIYCMAIAEEIEVGQELIFKIALNNFESAGDTPPDVRQLEVRTVNGQEVIRAVTELEISGMPLTYDAYYFSDERGTLQLMIWTGTNVYPKHAAEIEALLNGLEITETK